MNGWAGQGQGQSENNTDIIRIQEDLCKDTGAPVKDYRGKVVGGPMDRYRRSHGRKREDPLKDTGGFIVGHRRTHIGHRRTNACIFLKLSFLGDLRFKVCLHFRGCFHFEVLFIFFGRLDL